MTTGSSPAQGASNSLAGFPDSWSPRRAAAPETLLSKMTAMTILIDQAMWPAHDTLWAHLVSDTSLAELHAFAAEHNVPKRSFDLDHYDIPAERWQSLVDAGATPVAGRELVTRLIASGLRINTRKRRGL